MTIKLRRTLLALTATTAASACSLPATAADLGSACCVDLEERIYELEATAARKGNRKVSLTVSGWVNEAVFFWDDGTERNTYVGTNELEQSRVRFNGEARITGDWTAGYVLEIGFNGAGSKSFDQDDAGTSGVSLRKSAWFLKNNSLGKLSVGRFDTATYHLIDNLDTTLTRNVSDFETAGIALGAFKTRVDGVRGAKWTDFMGGFNNGTPGQSGLRSTARYDTPTFAGFTASASWGEDDQWETALRYKGELGAFAVAASIGYGESTDNVTNAGQCALGTGACRWWGSGIFVSHAPTGIFVYGGFAENHIDLKPGQIAENVSQTWYLQGGIERQWLSLGATNIFAEYRNDDVGVSKAADAANFDFWAAGIAQSIDAAAMTLYAVYRHADGDFTSGGATSELDAFDMVIAGAKINF